MTRNRVIMYAGGLACALGAGIKDGSVGSFLMVIGLWAVIEGGARWYVQEVAE